MIISYVDYLAVAGTPVDVTNGLEAKAM